MTLEDMRDLLYEIGIKFDRLPRRTRITLALACFNYNCMHHSKWYIFIHFRD